MNRPKAIGTAAETAVVRYLQANGFPHAERRAMRGTLDCGDITGTPGICWEVKGGEAARSASDGLIDQWLDETERERVNARADVGVLVVQRRGIGPANAGSWWAITPVSVGGEIVPVRWLLRDYALGLRSSDYGDPLGAAS